MIRDYTESFAPDFSQVLKAFGRSTSDTYQLLKFERMAPDVFVWLIRDTRTYVMAISDVESDIPNKKRIGEWVGGLDPTNLTELMTESRSKHAEDNFDKIHLYALPGDYDHDDHSGYYV